MALRTIVLAACVTFQAAVAAGIAEGQSGELHHGASSVELGDLSVEHMNFENANFDAGRSVIDARSAFEDTMPVANMETADGGEVHSVEARGGGGHGNNKYYYYYTTCRKWQGYCPSGYYKKNSRKYCNPYGYSYYYPACEKVCCYQYGH